MPQEGEKLLNDLLYVCRAFVCALEQTGLGCLRKESTEFVVTAKPVTFNAEIKPRAWPERL